MLSNKEMNLKRKKEQKAAELKREDIKLYRLIIEFILAVILVSAVISVGKGNEIYFVGSILPIVNVITAVLFAATAVNFVLVKKRGVDESEKIVTSAGIFGNAAVLFLSGAHYYLFMNEMQLSLTLVIITFLYFVYSIADKRFFDYSLFAAMGFIPLSHAVLELGSFGTLATLLVRISFVLAFVLPAFTIVRAVVKTVKGRLTVKYLVCVLITALVTLAGAVLVLVYPSAVIYTFFALLAVYLATTVVYTVRMM